MRISNGKVILTVSGGAYKEIYKSLGFYEMDVPSSEAVEDGSASFEPLQPVNAPFTVTDDENTVLSPSDATPLESTSEDSDDKIDEGGVGEDEGDETRLEETPLSELSFSELARLAEKLNLDVDGIRNKRELRLAIKAAQLN